MSLKQELLEILICPQCKGELDYDELQECLLCLKCRLKYKIKNDIPIMLIEEAEKI